MVVQLTAFVRVVLYVVMCFHAGDLWLYPLVFAVLVAQKTYIVSKSALVPTVVRSETELVEANSKLGIISAVCGAVALVPLAAIGKWHLTPSWEQSPAGPFDRWPTGLGFDRFYGIIGAEASQWEPAVYDQTTPIAPHIGRDGYHLTEDLADKAIEWLARQRASAPDRPWFCYFSTPAVHAPHHAPKEWIDRFAGAFDDGWDALRRDIFERQLELGVIPDGTRLTERPEQIPAWDDYPERFRPVATRLMECFAGFLAHTDAQIGRLVDYLESVGEMDNTLFMVCSDNGASQEGGPYGVMNEFSYFNMLIDNVDEVVAMGFKWLMPRPARSNAVLDKTLKLSGR